MVSVPIPMANLTEVISYSVMQLSYNHNFASEPTPAPATPRKQARNSESHNFHQGNVYSNTDVVTIVNIAVL